MLNQVPSGSKSAASGCATGCVRWKRLRFAISDQLPSRCTRMTPLGTLGTPCEQPAPASSAYRWWLTNATLETPLTRLPSAGLVWLDGSPRATTERTPAGVTCEIRPPSTGFPLLPVYGAAAPDACLHVPTVERDPPRPPLATYRSPFGPNMSPRGLLKPVAKTFTRAVCVPAPAVWPAADAAWPPAPSPAATASVAAARVARFMDDPSLVVEMVGLDPRNRSASPHRKICPVFGVEVAHGRPRV